MYRMILISFLFFSWYAQVVCSSSFSNSTKHLCHHNQNSALLRLKQSFSIDVSASSECDSASSAKTESWKEGTDCCSWEGVTCNRVTGHVIGLDLSCSGLYGSIDPSASTLFLLPHLRRLNLAFNDFNKSSVSAKFGEFGRMTHLNLSFSGFSGVISQEISRLTDLASLDLSVDRELIKLEPSSFIALAQNLTRLQKLHLRGINISSTIPPHLFNLSTLTSLDLSSCNLHGRLSPDDDHIHLPNLKVLKLSDNHGLTGKFPNFMNKSSTNSIWILDLSATNFTGNLPSSIGGLQNLKSLDLSSCNFFGSIPKDLGNLTLITHLDLSGNRFIGEVSDIFGKMGKLTRLVLSRNGFTGQFIASLDNLTELSVLDLSDNNLEGALPSHVKELSGLSMLDLSNNSLNGMIPSWIFSLPSLTALDLSHNKLTGHIDHREFQSTSLDFINLGDNELVGSIPSSIFELVNLTHLQLSSNNLSGVVETDMFINLENLIYLDLSNNLLTLSNYSNSNPCALPYLETLLLSSCNITEFPRFLCNQELLLFLDLSNNKIHGEIPKRVFEIATERLSVLDLSRNMLTGLERVPWKNMLILDLHSNLLQGPLPKLICEMSFIQLINFSDNNLSGLIPPCLGNSSKFLSVLDLRMNQLRGTIPNTFSEENVIRNLDFNGNQLEGPLPQSLINCSKLQVLDLGSNRINDSFPYWLETLPELQVLILRFNRFHGQIIRGSDDFRIPFPNLRVIDLSGNEFSGSLPGRYFKNFMAMMNVTEDKMKPQYMGEYYYQDRIMVTLKGSEFGFIRILSTFTTIDLSSNRFGGEIPESIGNLVSLRQLNLSHNNIAGNIPSSLGNLMVLESLDLSANELSGRIPSELIGLTFLEVVNFSNNHLTGIIPRGNQFNSFGNESYGGNVGLCGFPLSKKCVGDDAQDPTEEEEEEEENSSWFDWKLALMGYGCGVVIGLSIGCIVFLTGKPEWFVRMIEKDRRNKATKSRRAVTGWHGARRN